MTRLLGHLAVALAVTLAVGLLSGGGWAFLVGGGLSVSLWGMAYAGSFATEPAGRTGTSVRQCAVAGAVAVPLGYVIYLLGDENAAFWAVGFIVAGVVVPAGGVATRESRAGHGA